MGCGRILGQQGDIRKSAGSQYGGNERAGPDRSGDFEALGKRGLSQAEINAERVLTVVGHRDVRYSAVRKIVYHDSPGRRRGRKRRYMRRGKCVVQTGASQSD